MSKYTITIKGEWDHQLFELTASTDEDTIQRIKKDILFTVHQSIKQPSIEAILQAPKEED